MKSFVGLRGIVPQALLAAGMLVSSAMGQELVVNGSFEDEIGAEWTFYGTTDFDQFTGWFGVSAQDGDWLVGSAVDGGRKNGGLRQQVAVTPGTKYLYTGWVYSWKNEALGRAPEGRIGVDLDGGTDPEAPGVLWNYSGYTGGAWVQLGIVFTATGPTVTIFMDMVHYDAVFNITALDNASVTETQSGTIRGTVYDASSDPLMGATVQTDPLRISAVSAADGSYSLEAPAGTYDVTAELIGYDGDAATGLVVTAGGTVVQDFHLAEQTCAGLVFGNGGFETGTLSPWTPYGVVGMEFPGPDPWLGGMVPYEGDKFWASARNGGANGAGGAYQQVCVTPGVEITATAQSALFYGANAPQVPDGTRNRIGIDPTGGTDPAGPDVVWSEWDTQANAWFWEWHEVEITTTALAPTVTIFLDEYQANEGGDQWHINAWDDVRFAENLPDSDGDGMDDYWETANGLDPYSAEGDDGADGDPDGDGSRNLDEYGVKTHPRDWHSAFRVVEMRRGNSVVLEWEAGVNGPFRVFRGAVPDLADALAVRAGIAGTTFTDAEAGPPRYYRVALDEGFPPLVAEIADSSQIVHPGELVTLDASASSGDVFEWTQTEGAEVDLDGAQTTVATFTAPAITTSVERLAFTFSVNRGAASADAEVYVVSPVIGETVLYARDFEGEAAGPAPDYVGRPSDRAVTVVADGSGRSVNVARLDIGATTGHGGVIDTAANGHPEMIAALNEAGAATGYVIRGDVLWDPPGAEQADRLGIWGFADPDEARQAIALILRGKPDRMTLRLAQYTMHAESKADENTVETLDPFGPGTAAFAQWYRLELILLHVPGTDTVICEGRAWNVEAGDPRPEDPDVSGVVTLPAAQDEFLAGIYGYSDSADVGWVDDFEVRELE